MKHLAQPNAAWLDDDGAPQPSVRARLAEAEGQLGYLRAVVALGGARLLLPILATGDDSMAGPDPDRHAEMAAVTIDHPKAGRALVVFSGLDALQAWHRQARPVPCTLDDVAATVIHTQADCLVVDPAGPYPVTILDDVIAELARGRRLVELDDGGFGWASLATKPDER